jgi:HEAT repeat protein
LSHPIIERLEHSDPEVRRTACQAAAEDPAATLLSEALSDTLGDPCKAVARAASDALVAIGRERGGVEPALRRALHSDDPGRRWGAAFTAARLQPPGPRLLPALVEALSSGDGDVRWAAARLLVETGRLHLEVLPLLVGLVRGSEQAVVRRMAGYALRELAPDRAEAAAVLLEATHDRDLHVRRAAFTAMASLVGPGPEVSERLLEALREDPDAATRRLAALALGELGAAQRSAAPPGIESALQAAREISGDPDLRRAVDRALERLAAGSRAVPAAEV